MFTTTSLWYLYIYSDWSHAKKIQESFVSLPSPSSSLVELRICSFCKHFWDFDFPLWFHLIGVYTLTFNASMLRITLIYLAFFQISSMFLLALKSGLLVFSNIHIQCCENSSKLLHLLGRFIFSLKYSKTNSGYRLWLIFWSIRDFQLVWCF